MIFFPFVMRQIKIKQEFNHLTLSVVYSFQFKFTPVVFQKNIETENTQVCFWISSRAFSGTSCGGYWKGSCQYEKLNYFPVIKTDQNLLDFFKWSTSIEIFTIYDFCKVKNFLLHRGHTKTYNLDGVIYSS